MRIAKQDLRAAAIIREMATRPFADRAAAVTVREIAAAAGASPGLVMHHYGSEDGLAVCHPAKPSPASGAAAVSPGTCGYTRPGSRPMAQRPHSKTGLRTRTMRKAMKV